MTTKSRQGLTVLFIVTTAASAALAVYLYSSLSYLRLGGDGNGDLAALQKKLWNASQKVHQMEDELASLQNREYGPAGTGKNRDRIGRNADRAAWRGNRNVDTARAFEELTSNPDYQKLMALQQRAALDKTYAALFKSLNLSPQQLEQFKNLLVEKQMAFSDVMNAARDQGLNPRNPQDRTQINQLLAQTNTDLESNIQQTLGTQYSDYQNYEQTLPQRNDVNQLAQKLSYTGTPLQDYQTEQLVKILADYAPQRTNTNAGATPTAQVSGNIGNAINPNRTAPITQAAVNQAQSILSQPQVDALVQLQQDQQAQQKMNQLLRNQTNPSAGAT
ncbi:MAG TPA: hypothetical protein VKC60_11205, partial [Opitutaceae bacterium]|nr:hypothetical protein [Opitutaceae bacterium]